MEGEGVESFCLRDAEFKILVRNANLDIKDSVGNLHLVFWERLGLEGEIRESALNTEPLRCVAGSGLLGRQWSCKCWSALFSL